MDHGGGVTIYIYIYLHTYIPTYLRTYLPTYIHTYTYVCFCKERTTFSVGLPNPLAFAAMPHCLVPSDWAEGVGFRV